MLKRKSTDFRRDYFKLIFYIVMRWVLKIIENEEGDENGEIIYYDELFWALSLNDIDESIIPFIELLKTRDIKKAINALRISKFKVSENIEESFKNFVDYLLQDDRYKDFFKQSMGRYNITEYNREIYKEIFDTTMQELEEKLYTVKNYKNGELYEFNDSHVDKIDKDKIVTENAYVLFYSRKRENKINEEELFKKPFIKIDHTLYE